MFEANALTLAVTYAVGHRIHCAHCREPYVVLETGTFAGTGGEAGYSPDAKKMAAQALNTIRAGLSTVVTRPGGEGRCPACHRYQPRMVAAARKFAIGLGVGGAAVGAALGYLAAVVLSLGSAGAIAAGAAALVGGIAFGLGITFGAGTAPDPTPDPFSKSEKYFFKYVAQTERDPLLSWAADTRRGGPPEGLPVALGVTGRLPDEVAHLHVDRVFPTVKLSYDERRGRLKLRDRISDGKVKASTSKKKVKAPAPRRKARRR